MKPPASVLAWKDMIEPYLLGSITRQLILAIIWQESNGIPWWPRYEENYQYFFDYQREIPLFQREYDREENRRKAKSVLGATEFHCQSMSWGLMQIMGAAARERGFRSGLPELTTPECNLQFSIKHLWQYGFVYGKKTTEQGLERYNGSPIYADEVMLKLGEINHVITP